MLITGNIDLTATQKAGTGATFYIGLVHRDSMLYFGINYLSTSFDNYADSSFVGIVNRNTQKFTKLIADGRTSVNWTPGTKNLYSGAALVLDENNDIYVQGVAGATVPSGIVRIKNGQTNFDPSYFFNLTTATGGNCIGIHYYGNGKALICKNIVVGSANYPFDSTPPSPIIPEYRYQKIDLYSKSSQGDLSSSLPDVFSSNAFITKWDANKAYINVPSKTEDAIWEFDKATGVVSKSFISKSGTFIGFAKLN